MRMVQVFVALLCAANPLEKTKCELDGPLSDAQPPPATCPATGPPGLLLLSGYRDHLSKGEFTCFLGILSQIFSGFQEVFSVDTSEQLWALAVPHRNVRELVWYSCPRGHEELGVHVFVAAGTREQCGPGRVCSPSHGVKALPVALHVAEACHQRTQ